MERSELVSHVLADVLEHVNRNPAHDFPLDLAARISLCPEARRWLRSLCPVCEAELFCYRTFDRRHIAQWCSDDIAHFELEEVTADEPENDGIYLRRIQFKLRCDDRARLL